MAQLYRDFADDTIGVAPTGFAETGASALATWLVQAVASGMGGKALRGTYTPDGGGASDAGLLWTAAPVADADGAEVVAKMRFVSGPSVTWPGLAVDAITRARGGDQTSDGVVAEARHNDNTLRAQGFSSALASVAFAAGTDWFLTRVRRVGQFAWVRAWLDGDDEPGAWDIEDLDLGVGVRTGGQPAFWIDASPTAAVVEFDFIGVGTDGDEAPTRLASIARYDFTIFEDDGVTPVLGEVDGELITEPSFSTDPDHPRPYLGWPKDSASPKVDFRKGKAVIGQVNLLLQDKRTVATDQTTGLVTSLLGPYQGFNGLRGRLTYTPADPGTGPAPDTILVIDGPISTPKLHTSYAGFELSVKDENARARKVKVFDRTGTTCILPRGPVEPWGLLPSGKYAVAAAGVVVGTYEGNAAQGIVNVSGGGTHSWQRALTQAMAEAVKFEWDEAAGAHVLKKATLRWRPVGGDWGDGAELVDMPRYQFSGILARFGREAVLFATHKSDLRLHGSDGSELTYRDAEVITGVRLRTAGGAGDLPANGTAIELQVIYTGPATKAYPLHFSGTGGDFLAAFYGGEFCTQPFSMRFDPVAVAAFAELCNARITEVADDGLAWLEKSFFVPLAAAPTIDNDGRISPTRYLLPDENTELLTIDNAVAAASADWSHPDTQVVNEFGYNYFRDIPVDPRDDLFGEVSDGDGVWARPILVEAIEGEDGSGPSHDRFLTQRQEIKTELFRGIGAPDGTSAGGEATLEVGHVLGRERGLQALDRFLYGVQAYSLRTLRSLTGALRLGDWVEVGVSWLPDYISQLRGANRLAQVIGIDDVSPVERVLHLEDGGDALAPLAQPTVGVAAENAQGGVTLPVTAVVGGTFAVVEYAISALQPAHDSKLWTAAGRLDAAGSIGTPQIPAGASVWIGARSVAEGRRPSLRTTPQQVVTTEQPRLTDVRVEVDEDTGAVTVKWTPNEFALGVRISYWIVATEDQETTTAAPTAVDVDASLGTVTLADTALIGQVVIVDAEPFDGFAAGAVSGFPGPEVRAYSGLGVGPAIKSVTLTHSPTGTLEIAVELSSTVTEWRAWRRNGSAPTSGGEPVDVYLAGVRKPAVTSISVPVQDGTYHVLIRAYDGVGPGARYVEQSATIAITGVGGGTTGGGPGGPGTAPTTAPPVPTIAAGLVSGSTQDATLSWLNTNGADDIEVAWYSWSALDSTDTRPAGSTTAQANFDVTSPNRVKARIRYTAGPGLEGPWSGFSRVIELRG